MKTARIVIAVLIVVGLVEAAAIFYFSSRTGWQEEATLSAIERGRMVAENAGCFGCHGPGGTSPVANPGAKYGEVPGWGGGTWMLWSNDKSDVRAWIVDGHPPDRSPDDGALIPMPAYGDVLTDAEIDDVVGYVLAVSNFGVIDDPLAKEGRKVANQMGCFGCHGPEGRGLVRNPGSYKGYIPAWDSVDYLELVQNDDEFREWVLNGISARFQTNPAARAFLGKAAIEMPAYRGRVTDQDVDALLAYVDWVRHHPRW